MASIAEKKTYPVELPFKYGLCRSLNDEVAVYHRYENKQAEEPVGINVRIRCFEGAFINFYKTLESVGGIRASDVYY